MKIARLGLAATSFLVSLGIFGQASAQNATEKLALGLPIGIEDLRGQEFIGRLTRPNSKEGYSVRVKFENQKPKVEVIGSTRLSVYGTNFDEPTLTAATGYENGSVSFNFKTMEATTKDGATGLIMHSDFGCWFRDTTLNCPKHVEASLVAKYKPTFEDIKSENKAFEKNSKTQNTTEAFLTVIKPRIQKFAELTNKKNPGQAIAPAAVNSGALPSLQSKSDPIVPPQRQIQDQTSAPQKVPQAATQSPQSAPPAPKEPAGSPVLTQRVVSPSLVQDAQPKIGGAVSAPKSEAIIITNTVKEGGAN